MSLLVSDGFGFAELTDHPMWGAIANQFHHRPWGGAVFYDLMMPAFLFMVGVATPYSLGRGMEHRSTVVCGPLDHLVPELLALSTKHLLTSFGHRRSPGQRGPAATKCVLPLRREEGGPRHSFYQASRAERGVSSTARRNHEEARPDKSLGRRSMRCRYV